MASSQTEEWKCDLCGETHTGWGNNPEPIKSGRCCDRCNSEYVIPVRICGVTDEQLEQIRAGLDSLKDGKKEHCIHCGFLTGWGRAMSDSYHEGDFPFEEIAQFSTWKEARSAGVEDKHLWSVIEGEDDGPSRCQVYGPPHHYVNLIHIVQTAETHDGKTYYEETWEAGE